VEGVALARGCCDRIPYALVVHVMEVEIDHDSEGEHAEDERCDYEVAACDEQSFKPCDASFGGLKRGARVMQIGGERGHLLALFIELSIEAGVRGRGLREIGAKALGHLLELLEVFALGLMVDRCARKSAIEDRSNDVRQMLDEFVEKYFPHGKDCTAWKGLYGVKGAQDSDG